VELDEQDITKLLGNKGEVRVQTGTRDWLMIDQDAIIKNDLRLAQRTVKIIIHLF
jgi:hypothetical protein